MSEELVTNTVASDVRVVRDDLLGEHDALDEIVAHLDDEQWRAPTPSPGWNVADQIGHLTFFDHRAATAIADPDAFRAHLSALVDAAPEGLDEYTLGSFRRMSPGDQLLAWRHARQELARASVTLIDEARVAWYGPPMSAKSFLSARLMETWAHGHDVADALHVVYPNTERLRHVAQLGYLTRAWSYRVRGEEVPVQPVRLELTSPSGQCWTWGSDDLSEFVEGSALDFCLVVTQRRHVADTALLTSELGHEWMVRAQAFAGPPSDGPAPKSAS